MSIQNDILTEMETAVRSDPSLGNANIYKRMERKDDRLPQTGQCDVYFRPIVPEPAESAFVLDGRTYPVEVTLRFAEEVHATDEADRDVIVEQMSFYTDAILRALRFGQITYPTGVYHHEFAGSDPEPEGPEGIETGATLHRVRITVNFHALVDPNVVDGGGASDDDSTSVVLDGGWN